MKVLTFEAPVQGFATNACSWYVFLTTYYTNKSYHTIMKKLYTTLFMLLSAFMFTASAQVWTMQNVGYTVPAAYPNDIDIVDPNIVWTGASQLGDGSGAIVQLWSRTIDGGLNWTSGSFTADVNYQVSNISGVDANTCYILTFNYTVGSTGYLFKTVDGGVTWDTVHTELFSTAGVSFPNVVHFFDANNGFLMGDPEAGEYEIYTTADAGVTWTRVPGANIPDPLSAAEYGIINVYGAQGNHIWFGTNNGRVYQSHDMGMTWVATTAGTASTSNSVTGVSFRDSLNGFVLRSTTAPAYTSYKTSDAGATWVPVTPSGTFFKSDFMYVPGTTGMISVGGSATGRGTSISYDDGANWELLDTAGLGTVDGYTTLDFLNATTGWAGSFAVDALTDGINKWIGGTVGLTTPNTESLSLHAYPNPSSNLVYVETNTSFKKDVTVSIVDMLGKVISIKNYAAWSNPLILNLSTFENGVYLVRVSSGDDVMVKRIVKN
jgi:hypothetical protein